MSSDIVIEITGLKSLSKFIGLEDTPLYYDNGKFFKVEDNKIIYADIEWKDISGNIEEAPQIVDLIEDFVKTISGETIQGYIEEHNSSELAHPYIQNAIQEEISARTEADNTLQNNIDTLSDTVSSNYTILDTKINDTKTSLEGDISDLSDIVSQNYTDLNNAITTSASTINSRIDSEVLTLNTAISTETANRQNADNNLQSQIDAIVSSSDVFDIVGTYAELQAYDISTVPVNDIVKVLVDSSHNNASTYYRCIETAGVKSWSYIGSEGAYYTKSESDTKFVDKTTTINKIPLSSNITLTASDVNALPDTTTIEDLTTTAQQNALNSGATSAKINRITTNTNNITTNTNDISIINDKIPYDASSSNKLVTISDLSNMDAYLANKDLSNLTNLGDGVNRAVKGYNEDGNLIYDKELVQDVTKYAHSSFDLSKFTVVGNPNITDDGIASGFSTSNRISTGILSQHISGTNWKIRYKAFIPETTNFNILQTNSDSATSRKKLQIAMWGSVAYIYLGDGTNSQDFSVNGHLTNTNILFELVRNGANYSMNLYDDNGTLLGTNSTPVQYDMDIASIAYIGGMENSPFTGSFDLKYFEVEVENKIIFSGNKTGIDTIKPDDYTVVGTPSISADGVASGFSNSNYLTTPVSITNNIKIDCTFDYNNINSYQGIIHFNTSDLRIMLLDNGNIGVYCSGAGAPLAYVTKAVLGNPQDNAKIRVVADITTSTSSVSIYVNNVLKYTLDKTGLSLNLTSSLLYIGKYFAQYLSSPIDLNAFKIYVDGNLDYQPCLKIPYTESAYKHGSKIVDMQYLPRVKDAYEQGYPNRYYALQEDYALNCSVVGTPTIVGTQASGFSNTSYLRQYFQNLSGKTLKIQNRFLYDSTISGCISHGVGTNNSPRLTASATNQNLEFYFRGTSDVTFTVPYSNFTANTWYNTEAIITPTKQIFQVTDDNGNVVFKETKSTTQTFNIQTQMATYTIGYRSSTNYFSGTVDLAGFKVFVDGNFVGSPVTAPCVALPMGDIYGEIENLKDLKSDLDRISQTKALATGNVANYEEELKQITDRKHSSFDLSKFTVVGSPNITDDGIASGFTTSNYVSLPSSYTLGTDFEVYFPFILSDLTTETQIYRIQTDNTFRALINFVPAYGVMVNMSDGTNAMSTGGNKFAITTTELTANELYIAVIKLKNQTCHYGCIHNGIYTEAGTIENFALDIPEFNTVFAGKGKTLAFTGSIDLKYFKFVANGVELISGNKTGVDTIKPDNYAVVGTPIISVDGVASGLDSSNSITCDCVNTDGEIIIPVPNIELSYGGEYVTGCYKLYKSSSWAYSRFDLMINTDNTTIIANVMANTGYDMSKDRLLLKVIKKGYDYTVSYKINDNDWVLKGTYTKEVEPTGTAIRYQGGYNTDLNLYKIYVGGNLVYQPCLKIPYTQSKTGSKIASSIYRDRVNDMAEQFGYANYYTLDEDNGNFTLPKGELYGLIGGKTLRDSYYNGVTYWELFSNRRLEQGGSCESGVEYTFPKPFADRNYVLTIPYSSKTETSFIPSATGDFIAKGMGLL